MSTISKSNLGDRVYSKSKGQGSIVEVDTSEYYCISVIFDADPSGSITFTKEGLYLEAEPDSGLNIQLMSGSSKVVVNEHNRVVFTQVGRMYQVVFSEVLSIDLCQVTMAQGGKIDHHSEEIHDIIVKGVLNECQIESLS